MGIPCPSPLSDSMGNGSPLESYFSGGAGGHSPLFVILILAERRTLTLGHNFSRDRTSPLGAISGFLRHIGVGSGVFLSLCLRTAKKGSPGFSAWWGTSPQKEAVKGGSRAGPVTRSPYAACTADANSRNASFSLSSSTARTRPKSSVQ